jgi:hypothetical protein
MWETRRGTGMDVACCSTGGLMDRQKTPNTEELRLTISATTVGPPQRTPAPTHLTCTSTDPNPDRCNTCLRPITNSILSNLLFTRTIIPTSCLRLRLTSSTSMDKSLITPVAFLVVRTPMYFNGVSLRAAFFFFPSLFVRYELSASANHLCQWPIQYIKYNRYILTVEYVNTRSEPCNLRQASFFQPWVICCVHQFGYQSRYGTVEIS